MTTDTKEPNPKEAFGNAKVPLGLVPATALIEMALAMLEGALKYGGHNYRVVPIAAMTYVDAAERHLKKYEYGQDRDPVTHVRELASVMACCAIIIDAEICGTLIDNRPPVAPVGPLLDANMQIVAHLKELFKDHHPKQYTWEDSPGLKVEGFPDGYMAEELQGGPGTVSGADLCVELHCGQPRAPGLVRCAPHAAGYMRDPAHDHFRHPDAAAPSLAPMDPPPPFAVPIQDMGPLTLPCGCAKRCKGHAVSTDAAKVDVASSPGNYAEERAAGPKDPQGRPYATTTADAEFPQPPPDYRIPASPRCFDPAD